MISSGGHTPHVLVIGYGNPLRGVFSGDRDTTARICIFHGIGHQIAYHDLNHLRIGICHDFFCHLITYNDTFLRDIRGKHQFYFFDDLTERYIGWPID